MKRLVLLGAGHAHLIVLREFAKSPPPDMELVLITPSPWQYYSGMLPGWISGHYTVDQCRIAVSPLVAEAGGELVLDSAVELEADRREIRLAGGERIEYDLLSIDIGSHTNLDQLQGYRGRMISVKPIETFYPQWQQLQEQSAGGRVGHLVVIGGGAAGVELAMAAANALGVGSGQGCQLSLVAGESGPLPGFNRRMQRLASQELSRLGVTLIEQRARAEEGELCLADGTRLEADAIIAATGASPARFLSNSGLTLDDQGFVLVDARHRSLSHPDVFAVGDTCSRQDRTLNRSGVHAVRAGPVLADNLRAALNGAELKPFLPRRYSLYLLACGGQSAIGSYGPLTFSGRWVWRLKDRIDRQFVEGFASH